jgi:drug/metabolite transporter (DMT)-like permease
MQNKKNWFYVGIVMSMLVWGVSWPTAKIVSVYGGVNEILWYRFVVVWVTLGLMMKWIKVGWSFHFKKGWLALLGAGSLMSLYSYFFLKGVKEGFAGAGGVLVTTLNPLCAFGLGWVLCPKKLQKNEVVGLFCGIVSAFFLLKGWSSWEKICVPENIYFFVAAWIWALLTKVTALGKRYGSSGIFSFYLFGITLLMLSFTVSPAEIKNIWEKSDGVFWRSLIFNGALSTSVCTTFYFYASTQIGAEKTSSFTFLVPMSAAVSSWLLVGEEILWNTVVGGILGVLAVYLIQSSRGDQKLEVKE